ncbi:MAG: Rid family detoxifying hydrolase [Chloroflexi bacterium]|nr:Rid family detoxifying hydrolase [Chloroflexota bacterium]
MKTISTPNAPQPAGHYSQAVIHGDTVYISGQLPVNPHTGAKVLGTIEKQAAQTLGNLGAILEASGSDRAHVLKVTVYLSDIRLWDRMNAVYTTFFGEARPARSVVPTRELHHGFLIEIDAVAAVIPSREVPPGSS